jgi:toxin-antitoxin system PIN domain toxin
MLVDVNLLVYAADTESPFQEAARTWLEAQLNGTERVGMPWLVLGSFLRLMTNPRMVRRAVEPGEAWRFVDEWLSVDQTWIPPETDRHANVLGDLIQRYELRRNGVPDARLVALAIEHGQTVCSNDAGFARFAEIDWANPLAGASAS